MHVYVDLNQFYPTEKERLFDVEAVYQSVINIIKSLKFERFFKPEFPGENLEDYLFELIDDISAVEVFRVVTGAIERWEPRVKIINRNSTVYPVPEENRYELQLVFRILGFGEQHFELKGNLSK